MKLCGVASPGIVRSVPSQLPSLGISLGVSGSDLSQASTLFRINRLSFWEIGDLTQYAKNLSMVTGVPLLLVITISRSLIFTFGVLRDIEAQEDAVGAMGVKVEVAVFVADGVKLGILDVFVRVTVGGSVFVAVGIGVRVRVAVFTGVRVRVGVAVQRGVQDGSTKVVPVGVREGDGVPVGVFVKIGEGVEVIALCNCCCASAAETGLISPGAQYCPVIVQAVLNSAAVSGWGAEGPLMD